MIANSDMTLYHWDGSGYIRQEIRGVFWSSSQISNRNKTGQMDSDSVFICIPEDAVKNLEVTVGKDLTVQGSCPVIIDNSSPEARAESMDLIESAYDVFTVTAFDPKLYGSKRMRHYELSCK